MKIKIIPSILTAAILSFLLSFGGVSCLVTAFHLDISLPALALCCGLCALGGCAVYVFCYYFVKVAGINAVVWGLLASVIFYFLVSKLTIGKGLDQDVLDKCF